MRVFLLCVALARSAYGEPAACGCPWTNATGAGYDSSKLFVMSGGTNKCTIACERGYTMQFDSDYVECTDGNVWRGHVRDGIGGSNPFIMPGSAFSCVESPPVTPCTENPLMNKYECADCDLSKMMTVSSQVEPCTIQCDRNYNLVANERNGIKYSTIASMYDTGKGYSMKYIDTLHLNSKGYQLYKDITFSCKLIAGAVPPGTTLATTPTPTLPAKIDCTMGSVPGTINELLVDDARVVSCLTGKISVSLSETPGDSVTFERATCAEDGTWFGTSCDGHVYHITSANSFFSCPDVITPTTPTTPTVPPPLPCACAFENVGESQNMAPPTSLCTNKVNQVLQCDDKIYVKDGDDVVEFDRVSCSAGQWFGTGCDGTISALSAVSVKVQCGKVAEPPLCPHLPSRGGLRYIGEVNGKQRYTCRDNEDIRIKAEFLTGLQPFKIRSKFFDCEQDPSTEWLMVASNGEHVSYGEPPKVISDVSCRDYGSLGQACSLPWTINAFREGNQIVCEKGSFVYELHFFNTSNMKQTLSVADHNVTSVTCEIDGWSMAEAGISGVQLIGIQCVPINIIIASDKSILISPDNVHFHFITDAICCLYSALEHLLVVTPDNIRHYGSEIQKNGYESWELTTGASPIPIPANSTVSCVPIIFGMLPEEPSSLVYAGTTTDGLTRWTCLDSTIAAIWWESIMVHAKYLEANQTHYRLTASLESLPFTAEDPIDSIKCEDMGPMHAACSVPWDVLGVRKGNRYECMKGYYLKTITYIDERGAEQSLDASKTDTKTMQCNMDGWQIEGTSHTGVRVAGFTCEHTATYMISYYNTDCDYMTAINSDYRKLQFDSYRQTFTCYEGETLGYTLNGVRTYGKDKKLFCGKNASSAHEWQWSMMDGSGSTAIPIGAYFTCFF